MKQILILVRFSLTDAVLAGSDSWGQELIPVTPSTLTGKQRTALASLPTAELGEDGLAFVMMVDHLVTPDRIPFELDQVHAALGLSTDSIDDEVQDGGGSVLDDDPEVVNFIEEQDDYDDQVLDASEMQALLDGSDMGGTDLTKASE